MSEQAAMRPRKTTIFLYIFIVTTQILIIIGILYYISDIKKQSDVLSATTVSEEKSNFFKPENTEFNYYYELTPSVTQIEPRYWNNTKAEITVNEDGLNDRFNYTVDKPENAFRILTLGDSFTYGQRVNTKFNWAEKLEDMLNNSPCLPENKYEVINLGMIGFDIPYIVKRFIDKGRKYNPDLIVWFESGSGFSRDVERMHPLIKACENEFMLKNNTQVTTAIEDSICWEKAQDEIIKNTHPESVRKRVLEWMEYFFNAAGNTPVVIVSSSGMSPSHKELVKELINKQSNLSLFESDIDLKPENGTTLSSFDRHPNEKGHLWIAADIYNYILNSKGTTLSYEGVCNK